MVEVLCEVLDDKSSYGAECRFDRAEVVQVWISCTALGIRVLLSAVGLMNHDDAIVEVLCEVLDDNSSYGAKCSFDRAEVVQVWILCNALWI